MRRKCETGKINFRNYGDAFNALKRARKKDPKASKLRNVYHCEYCDHWHMTSAPRHARKANTANNYFSMLELQKYALELRADQLDDATVLKERALQLETYQDRFRSLITGCPQSIAEG